MAKSTSDETRSRSVVITGVGPVSAIGTGIDDFSRGLGQGRTGIEEITSFETEEDWPQFAAEIVDFDVAGYLPTPKNYLDRNTELAFAAMHLVLEHGRFRIGPDAGMGLPRPERVGLCLGSAFGNAQTLELFNRNLVEKGPRLVPPFLFQHTYPNTTISLLSIEYGPLGFNCQFASGAVAGAEAVAYAVDQVRLGKADAVIAGGVDAFSRAAYLSCMTNGMLAGASDASCRPMDPHSRGTILGEGAALALIESESCAAQRRASVRGEVLGVAVGTDVEQAMRGALDEADAPADTVDAVFASANGIAALDEAEARAVRSVFGATPPFVAAPKAWIGETLGASGPLALAAALVCLESGRIPEPMAAACTGPHPGYARRVLVNATDGGGACVAILLGQGT